MNHVLENLRKVDPNDSDAVKDIITTYFQNLTKHNEVNCNVWLRALESVITRFPKYCAQHRITIEKYLVHFLDSPNYYNVIEAAKCAHGLQQICLSQEKKATAKNCWREQMNILCHVAHKLMDALFDSTLDIYKTDTNIKELHTEILTGTPLTVAFLNVLNLKKVQSASDANRNMVLCYKLRNIFIFIQAMLVEVYPVGKPVRPQMILEVIVRALSASGAVDADAAHAAVVKTHALRTLDALVACLGSNLIPFSALVFKCVMQTLRWTLDRSSEDTSRVRRGTYASLARWAAVARGASGASGACGDQLVAHVLADITQHERPVQLTMSNQYTKKLSKKARRKLTNTTLQQSSLASHSPAPHVNKPPEARPHRDQLALAALACAETFLLTCGALAKPATCKLLQERVVRECYVSERHRPCADRLVALLRVARALPAARHGGATHHLLQLCAANIAHPHEQVRTFCSRTLLELKLHLHCSPPSLNFASQLSQDSVRDTQQLSHRNSDALDSLLDKHRIVQPAYEVNLVDEDEPSNKRARLGPVHVATNISVSSDSNSGSVLRLNLDDDDDDDVIVVNGHRDRETCQLPVTLDAMHLQLKNTVQLDDNTCDRSANEVVDIATRSSQPVQELEQVRDNIVPETNIYEATTQLLLNTSTDRETAEDDEGPGSIEVVYDPNKEDKVTVLERIEDENLPSTNDTDDVQITCGQVLHNSQEVNLDKNKTNIDMLKVNGTHELVAEGDDDDAIENVEEQVSGKEITMDDMLADFLDEPHEEVAAEA